MREEVFLGVLKRVMTEVEGEALKEANFCEKCGLVLVRNGRERRNGNLLLKLRFLKLNGNGMFIGNSVEKNLSDMLLDLYHGKKGAYILLISIDDHSKKW